MTSLLNPVFGEVCKKIRLFLSNLVVSLRQALLVDPLGNEDTLLKGPPPRQGDPH